MPLNFFKRSKQPEKTSKQNVGSSQNLNTQVQQKKRYDAALEFLEAFQTRMPLRHGRPHPGTALSVAARLAGTSLFRAINQREVGPDVVVLSEEVNKAYPKLLNMFAHYNKKSGIDVMAKPPVTTFPEGDKPLMSLSQIQAEYQNQYNEIMQKHGLDYTESAYAGMIVASIIFDFHCIKNKDIDPYIATGIVAMGVVEGAKTGPVPLDEKKAEEYKMPPSPPASVSRFVVGELGAMIEDVRKHGGQYTQLNPAVEAALKAKNIDPKLVYIQGLESQLEEKVGRVDFVQMDIETVLRQAKNDKMPIPVSLAHWMNENSGKYGYQREGNSWVLAK